MNISHFRRELLGLVDLKAYVLATDSILEQGDK